MSKAHYPLRATMLGSLLDTLLTNNLLVCTTKLCLSDQYIITFLFHTSCLRLVNQFQVDSLPWS
jgi:hypothetical protein